MAKKWIVKGKTDRIKSSAYGHKEMLVRLLKIRGVKSKNEAKEFIAPVHPSDIGLVDFGINKSEVRKAVARIKKAIKNKEKVIVYGDYDGDGVTATAICWEVLYFLGADVFPFIPKREEGYGLNVVGIDRIMKERPGVSLIITVDNGIVAGEGVEYCAKNNIDVIISDHHVKERKKPKALATIHTTKLSGSGVAWVLAREVIKGLRDKELRIDSYLDLAAIGALTDLIPLVGVNRSLVKHGLSGLNKTKRIGLLEIIKESRLELGNLGVYEVGYIIGPRLNAAGRLEDAMESLRALCVKKGEKASVLAKVLEERNRERQALTVKTTLIAKMRVEKQRGFSKKKILIVSGREFNPGVIGLVAGKLVDQFYKPAIAIYEDKKIAKGSARSITGIDIIALIRKFKDLLIDCGGHPMAAGFSIKKINIVKFKKEIEKEALKFDDKVFIRTLKIDLEIGFPDVNYSLYKMLSLLRPYGVGNPEPVFMTRGVRVVDKRTVGRDGGHLKMKLDDPGTKKIEKIVGVVPSSVDMLSYMDTIGFGLGNLGGEIKLGDFVDVVYTVSENVWNGQKNLQLKIRDVRKS